METISKSYDDAEAELRTTRQELENELSPKSFEMLSDRVEAQVEQSLRDVHKVIEVRQERLDELNRAARREEDDDPDIFERVSARLKAIHPEAIAEDIQEATQFNGLVDDYRRFARGLQDGPLTSRVASRYVLPDEAVEALVARCAVPFENLEEPLGALADAVRAHVEEIDEITSSKLGKGIAAFANITSSLAMGAATSALTGNPFLGRSTRKEASSGIGGWVAKKYFGSDLQDSTKSVERSFQVFAGEYDRASMECGHRVELTVLTLYGGLLRQLEQDLGEADQRIKNVEWDDGLVEPTLSQSGRDKFSSWAEQTVDELEDLEDQEEWDRLGDAAEQALQFSLDSRARSQATGHQNGTAYATIFAQKRALAVMRVAEIAWQSGNYVAAAQLYLDLFAGSPVGFDSGACLSAVAGWRLALVGTSERAPDPIADRSLDVLPYIQQVRVRQDVQDGHYSIPGETLLDEAEDIATTLDLFASETGAAEPEINRRVAENIDGGKERDPTWLSTNPQSFDFEAAVRKHEIPEDLESSKLAQWLISGRDNQVRRRRLMIGTTVLVAAALSLLLLYWI